MIASCIELVLSNPTISLLILGLIASLISLCFKKKPLGRVVVVEALVAYFFPVQRRDRISEQFRDARDIRRLHGEVH